MNELIAAHSLCDPEQFYTTDCELQFAVGACRAENRALRPNTRAEHRGGKYGRIMKRDKKITCYLKYTLFHKNPITFHIVFF